MQRFFGKVGHFLQQFWKSLKKLTQRAFRGARKTFKKLTRGLRKFKRHILTNFTRWVDPRLEKYRVRRKEFQTSQLQDNNVKNKQDNYNDCENRANRGSDAKVAVPETSAISYAPATLSDFMELIKRTPKTVLTGRERNLIAAVMSFDSLEVGEIMLPKEAITYVHDDEILGPLMLDRLYKSGFSHFPVVDHTNEVVGIIHTSVLNSLEEKETHRAGEFMDKRACFLRMDYTLNQALAAFYRTNSYFFIVVDKKGKTVGLLTYQMLMNYLFGKKMSDDFTRDSDRMAVARREITPRG